MLRGVTDRLLSRSVALAALGFDLSLIGALGSAFYLEPAQRSENEASQEIALASAGARMLRAARPMMTSRGIWAVSCSLFRCRATRATTSGRGSAT
jgi:hypothetical protein